MPETKKVQFFLKKFVGFVMTIKARFLSIFMM